MTEQTRIDEISAQAALEAMHNELTGLRLSLFEEEQENRRLRTRLLDSAPELGWARGLEAGGLHDLMSELSAALLGYWHDDPDVEVLARAMKVLHEHRKQAAEAAAEAVLNPDAPVDRDGLLALIAENARLRAEATQLRVEVNILDRGIKATEEASR